MKSLRDAVNEERRAYRRWQKAKRENWGSYGGPRSEWALFFWWKAKAAQLPRLFGVWRPRPGATLVYRGNEQTQSIGVGVEFKTPEAP